MGSAVEETTGFAEFVARQATLALERAERRLMVVVPLALARPRISWAWGLMWVFWLIPAQENGGDLWRVAVAVGVVGAVAGFGMRVPFRGADA